MNLLTNPMQAIILTGTASVIARLISIGVVDQLVADWIEATAVTQM